MNMQCPSSPRNVQRSRSGIRASPITGGRLPATQWSIHKNNDAVADYEVNKPLSSGGPKQSQVRSKSRGRTKPLTSATNKTATTTTTTRAGAATRTATTKSRFPSRAKQRKTPSARDYQSWDFGKPKTFKKPAVTLKNKIAATTLQRFFRGWWTRINFKLALMEYKLSHKHELTLKAMEQMEKGVEKKKQYERNKLEAAFRAKAQEEESKNGGTEQVVSEGKDIIAYLRKENKKLRDKNTRIHKAAKGLKAQNDRLEGVNTQTDGNMDILETHAKQIEETHTKLNHVVPKYKISVAQLSNAAEQHRQYCVVEHSIKLMYVKLIGTIVDMLEERSKQPELTDEIVGLVLAMEGKDNDKPLPEKLPTGEEATELLPHPQYHHNSQQASLAKNGGGIKSSKPAASQQQSNGYGNHDEEEDSDSEDYDEYSVATFD